MQKMKHIIVLLICQAILLTLFVPTVASGDYSENDDPVATEPIEPGEEMSLEEQLLEMTNQIKGLQEQVIKLQAIISAAERSSAVPLADKDEIARQITESTESEKYLFQIEYYNICLIIVENDILYRQQALIEKKLQVEGVRLRLGLSTQNSIDDLNTILSSIKNQISINSGMIRTKKQQVNEKKGEDGYEYIKDYEIPELYSPLVESVDELKEGLKKNNVSLYLLDNQIKKQNDLLNGLTGSNTSSVTRNSVRSEIGLLKVQQELLVKQLELTALSKWTAYLDAKAQYEFAQAKHPKPTDRLALLDETYRLGKISEVEWLDQRFSAYEELNWADKNAIMLVIAAVELDFVMKGVTG